MNSLIADLFERKRRGLPVANVEGSAFDKATFSGYTGAENGGGYPLHSLPAVRAFRALGFNLLSCANTHASDYGIDGFLATRQTLIAIGFAVAGCGRSLDEARAPAFFDTPRGRVALAAAARHRTAPGARRCAG